MPNSVKKKTPERKCIGCSEKKAKNELIRVVRLPDGGGVEIDRTGKKPDAARIYVRQRLV